MFLGQISSNLGSAIVEDLHNKRRFQDDENIGLKSIFTAITINSIVLHPLNVVRTNQAIQIGTKTDKISTMSSARVLKEMLTRYGVQSLYKGFTTHYLPLVATAVGLVKFHSVFGHPEEFRPDEVEKL